MAKRSKRAAGTSVPLPGAFVVPAGKVIRQYTYLVLYVPEGCTAYVEQDQIVLWLEEPAPQYIAVHNDEGPCDGTYLMLVE